MIDSDVDSLEEAIWAHDREAARRESNRLTMPLAELAGITAASLLFRHRRTINLYCGKQPITSAGLGTSCAL